MQWWQHRSSSVAKMASVARIAAAKSARHLRAAALSAPITRNLSEARIDDKKTHTGQQWDEDDYRLARFVDRPKQINERFAINLIAEVPSTPIKGRTTSCNGGGGPLGHPKVYINLDKPGEQACGYCGLRFHQEVGHHH